MQHRRGDVEQWMSHRRLPEYLRRYITFSHFFHESCQHYRWTVCLFLDSSHGLLKVKPTEKHHNSMI